MVWIKVPANSLQVGQVMKFSIDLRGPLPTCGKKRGPRATVTCELQPDHEDERCWGRGRDGRWISWRSS